MENEADIRHRKSQMIVVYIFMMLSVCYAF